MNFILLTHERELDKPSNTGRLVKELMPQRCELIIWQRKESDKILLERLAKQTAVLLFPLNELPASNKQSVSTVASECSAWLSRYTHFVILDATWQQAKKMYRQSPYLQVADKLALDHVQPSTFRRRRNQREGGLCTVECVIELLRQGGEGVLLERLADRYERFNSTTCSVSHEQSCHQQVY